MDKAICRNKYYKQYAHYFNNYDSLCYRSIYQFIRPTSKPTTILLPTAQTTTLFEDLARMGIPHPKVIQLQQEGIIIVDEIANSDKTTIKKFAANLRRPEGHVQDLKRPNNVDGMIPTQLFVFSTRSRTRLETDDKLVRYYETVNCTITLLNTTWSKTVKNFQVQWKALEDNKNNDKTDVPAITKAAPVIKRNKPFRDYLHRRVGVRRIPLAYTVRSDANVPTTGDIATITLHSEEHIYIEYDIIFQASHTRPSF